MTGVELILAALATGAAAGVSESAGTAVRDAYAGLRDALRRRAAPEGAGDDTGTRELPAAEETEPGLWEARMRGRLVETGADRDERVLAAARLLLERAEAAGARRAGPVVNAEQAKGVQIGDHNTQTNHFS
ncbi:MULTISPECIES: hypothetical protein [unclassified Streptomyces]|uniref:hypothetical protein n=1 Tax=unclassified Streptomyces TaxID=2593676 RepID=UPI002E35B07A|nr:hypothetical protein [Streptomyces sp. NBC_01268]